MSPRRCYAARLRKLAVEARATSERRRAACLFSAGRQALAAVASAAPPLPPQQPPKCGSALSIVYVRSFSSESVPSHSKRRRSFHFPSSPASAKRRAGCAADVPPRRAGRPRPRETRPPACRPAAARETRGALCAYATPADTMRPPSSSMCRLQAYTGSHKRLTEHR